MVIWYLRVVIIHKDKVEKGIYNSKYLFYKYETLSMYIYIFQNDWSSQDMIANSTWYKCNKITQNQLNITYNLYIILHMHYTGYI